MKEYIVAVPEHLAGDLFRDDPELIRCKDCKCWKPSTSDVTEHICHWGAFRKNADDFCSWAERKAE